MKPTVAIIGIGLIGGSLGQALRRTRRYRVIGVARKARTIADARRLGAIDSGSTDLASAADADIVVLCGPVDTIVPLLARLAPLLKAGAVVTDVASVKAPIVSAARRILRGRPFSFVGAHPLAGSHRTGVKAAHVRLFEGSTVVLMPGPRAALERVKSLWRAVGAQPLMMSARDHDRAVAIISHLPHALAHALVHQVAGARDRRKLVRLLAGSFRDATRVASSDPEQWSQILRANAGPVRLAIGEFQRQLSRLRQSISTPRLAAHLRRSHRFRRPLFNAI
jgi:prephenate dehydrogenase